MGSMFYSLRFYQIFGIPLAEFSVDDPNLRNTILPKKFRYVRDRRYTELFQFRFLHLKLDCLLCHHHHHQSMLKKIQDKMPGIKMCSVPLIRVSETEILKYTFRSSQEKLPNMILSCKVSPRTHFNFNSKQAVSQNSTNNSAINCAQIKNNLRRKSDSKAVTNSMERSLKCTYCEKSYKRILSLQKHLNMHLNKRSYPCPKCSSSFLTSSSRTLHRKAHHPDLNLVCDICGNTYANPGRLRIHQMTHDSNEPVQLVCELCPSKKFKSHHALQVHLRYHKLEKRHECQVCGKRFSWKRDLEGHLTVHSIELPFKCSYCPKAFKRDVSLREHCRIHINEKSYSCKACNRSYATSGSRYTHQKYCQSKDTYTCDICNKNYANPVSLRVHKRTHNPNPVVYKCPVCDKGFRTRDYLNQHSRIHNPKSKTFSCGFCGYKCFTRTSLNLHSSTHTREKLRKCKLCSEYFISEYQKRIHIEKMHRPQEAEDAFPCQQCNNKYSTPGLLKIHAKVHRNRNIKCSFCEKRFPGDYALTQHMISHTKEYPYKCKYCPKRFKMYQIAGYHESTVHLKSNDQIIMTNNTTE